MATSVRRPTASEAIALYRETIINGHNATSQAGSNPPGDRWQSRAASFRGRLELTPEAEALIELTRPGDTWLDIGAGGGRYAIPLAWAVQKVVAVEPSPAMREQLGAATSDYGITNVEVVPEQWPLSSTRLPKADGALMANVLYGALEIGEFLDAVEVATTRVCAILTFDRAPNTPVASIWTALHGTPPRENPGLLELLTVLIARGCRVNVRALPAEAPLSVPLDDCVRQYGWMYGVQPGSALEGHFRELLVAESSAQDGLIKPPVVRKYTSLVWWEPDVR